MNFECDDAADVPQQIGSDDCGPMVCIFLERLMNKEKLYRAGENTVETATKFRERYAKVCYNSIVD